MKLSDKTAVVTGGGTGIGLGIARALADEGCRVVIGGRRADKLRDAAAVHAGKVPLLYQAVDVANHASVLEFIQFSREKLGRIDILVNSAGVNVVKRSMAELSLEEWDYLVRVNASGAYYCIREVLAEMRERQDGLIVNINSIAGKRASLLGGVGYTAAKFAMTGLGMTVGLEEKRNGIRVTNIYPGEVDTPILEQRPQPVSAEHRARILKPEDVAATVVMVACLPARAHVPELIIKPTSQDYT